MSKYRESVTAGGPFSHQLALKVNLTLQNRYTEIFCSFSYFLLTAAKGFTKIAVCNSENMKGSF
jgi:hypothetical protein